MGTPPVRSQGRTIQPHAQFIRSQGVAKLLQPLPMKLEISMIWPLRMSADNLGLNNPDAETLQRLEQWFRHFQPTGELAIGRRQFQWQLTTIQLHTSTFTNRVAASVPFDSMSALKFHEVQVKPAKTVGRE